MTGRPIPCKQLLVVAQHATGFVWSVPGNQSVTIAVTPLRVGGELWGIFRHGEDDRPVWTGSGWQTSNRPIEAIYRWSLAEALALIDGLVATEAARHEAWKRTRTAVSSADEFLAEYAEVASC